MDRIRYLILHLIVSGNLAAGAGQATCRIPTKCRVVDVEMSLGTTGATSGNTDVDVKKNGTSIMASATTLRIAQGSATKYVRANPTVGVVGEPSGVPLDAGDVVTVDIGAIPGTTSKDLTVRLLCAAVDV